MFEEDLIFKIMDFVLPVAMLAVAAGIRYNSLESHVLKGAANPDHKNVRLQELDVLRLRYVLKALISYLSALGLYTLFACALIFGGVVKALAIIMIVAPTMLFLFGLYSSIMELRLSLTAVSFGPRTPS